MKIAFASDHAGFEYKQILIPELRTQGYDVLDLGTNSTEPTDYPDQAEDVALAILRGEAERGILICGSGVGVSVAANKFKGIRAGVCHDNYSAHQSVEHDNANVICLGERIVGIEVARELVNTFLKAEFSNAPRHKRRVEKILAIENKNMKETNI
jgi:ribose 5-phosphate isomerase B